MKWGCITFFFFSSRRRHTRFKCDWSSDVCSSDLGLVTILSLAPIASAWSGRRTPSVTAAYMIPVLVLVFFIFVAPWLFIWPAVLAAAIAGPPTRKASLTFSRPTDDTPTYPA